MLWTASITRPKPWAIDAVFDYSDTPKIRVFDLDGNAQTVTFTAGTGYVPSTPSHNMVALTVADYTFVVNKSQTVAKDTGTVAIRPYEALISFGNIQPGSKVKVRVTESGVGTTTATLAISDTDPSDLDTNYVAAQIQASLASGLGANFTNHELPETDGSVIYLTNSTIDFTVSVIDSSHDLVIKVIKDKVQYFEDLPRQGQ
jgi:hypothetical protein